MLVSIRGVFGSGKTLLLTYFALESIIKGHNVIANYSLKREIDFVTPSTLEPTLDEKDMIDPQAINDIFLDEVYVWLDSRVSGSKKNRMLSYIILQSRKRRCNIYYTAQLGSSVDLRLRELTDYHIMAKRRKHCFIYKIYNSDYRLLKTVRIPILMAEKALYPEYDTNYIVRDKAKTKSLPIYFEKKNKTKESNGVQKSLVFS